MTNESVLKELLGKQFSKVSIFCLGFIKRSKNEVGVRKTFNWLQKLGITTEKIVKNASLLNLNPEIVQNHYDSLISLGISPLKIVSNVALLKRNPETIQEHYNYLTNIIKLEEDKIQNLPQLLLFNPDGSAKKLRIFKLDILGLKQKDIFNPNKYAQFYLASPATLLAKKNYCIRHKIDDLNNLTISLYSWRKLIKRVEKTLSDAEADNEGKRITRPYKQRYDTWMGEYKKWCREFYLRRGRRLIIKI